MSLMSAHPAAPPIPLLHNGSTSEFADVPRGTRRSAFCDFREIGEGV